MLVATHGYDETSRLTGIKAGTLRQWAKRHKWHVIPQHPQAVTPVTSPPDALALSLSELGKKTRYSLAKGLEKASEHVSEMPGAEILRQAGNVKQVGQAAALVHSWEAGQGNAGSLDLDILSGDTAIRIRSNKPAKGDNDE